MVRVRMLSLLTLIFLLSDEVSTCPAEQNPLTLDPPEVVRKFGEEVSVNCTSTVEDHDGMQWCNGITCGDMDEMFVTWSESVSDWNVNLLCKVKLNASVECSKDLKITVYKIPDEVYLHPVNAAVEGRQHELQCDIINVAPVQNLTVKWYRGNENVHTEIFNDNTSVTPQNMTSTLKVIPKRSSNGIHFTCKAELHLGPNGPEPVPTVTSEPYTAVVHYAPELINKTNVFDVEEGVNVTLSCEADGNPPPVYSWTIDGKTTENTSNPSHTITEVIANATYTCTASNDVGRVNKQINVYVKKKFTPPAASEPQKDCSPTLTPSELVVKFGESASINCSTSVMNFEGMGWEATMGGSAFVQTPFVTWEVKRLNVWDPEPSCYVALDNGVQYISKPSITVYKPPDNVFVSLLSDEPMVEDTEFTLRCHIIDVAPAKNLTVKWYRGNENVHTEIFNDITSVTPHNVTSTLKLIPKRSYNGIHFTCKAELHLGPNGPEHVPTVTSEPYTAVVHYAPELIHKTDVFDVEEGVNVTLSCEADGNPPPVYSWTIDGKTSENTSNPTHTITKIIANATYTCTASNDVGRVNKQINVYVIKKDCSPTLTPSELVVKFGESASINCSTSVMNFEGMGWEAPLGGSAFVQTPFVTWEVKRLNVWDPEPSCYVALDNGVQYISKPSITVYKPPDNVFVSSLSDEPMVEDTDFTLRCHIIDVAPEKNLTVKWYRGNENVHTEIFNDITSVTPHNVTSTWKVIPKRSYNGIHFTCKAELHLGPNGPEPVPTVTSKPYTAVVHFAPTFREVNISKEVRPGENVTFHCDAEGNPAPEIHWNYTSADNVRETTGGRQYLSIIEATSTNAAVYICVATNKVGKVTKFVTVKIKDHTDEDVPSQDVLWWHIVLMSLVIAVIVILILTLIISIHNYYNKRGQYTFISENIPLTTKSASGKA